jgi:tRNA A-37 threonylcarbamoyl transferase component Bud32
MVNLNVTKYSAVVAILDLRSTHFLQRTIQETFEQIFYNLQQQKTNLIYCGGGALDSIMVELEKPLQEKQIRYVCHEMCEGLEFLHDHKVIHRDLKAGNVLLTSEGHVKLGLFFVYTHIANTTYKIYKIILVQFAFKQICNF